MGWRRWSLALVLLGGCGAAAPRPDQADVVRRITTGRSAIQACYELRLAENPTLTGRIVAAMTIETSGEVTGAHVVDSTLPDEAVGTCLVRVLDAMTFDTVTITEPETFTFPFVFEPQ